MAVFGRREERSFDSFIDQIWRKYDVDGSNSISEIETKQLLIDISGHKHVNQQECKAFVKHIETSYLDPGQVPKNGIEKDHIAVFIENGIGMDENQRKDYAKRGRFQKMLIDFFNGFEEALEPYMLFEQQKKIEYFDELWRKYDVDGSHTISVEETKQLIEDMTGRSNITKEECQHFVTWLISNSEEPSTSSGEIEKIHLIDFVDEFLSMSTEEWEEYASRGNFHKTLVDFIVGVDHGLDNYQTKGKSNSNNKQKNKKNGDIAENQNSVSKKHNNVHEKPGCNNHGNGIKEVKSKHGHMDVWEDNDTAEANAKMIEVKLDASVGSIDVASNDNIFGRGCFFYTDEEESEDDNDDASEARKHGNIQKNIGTERKDREEEMESEGEGEEEEAKPRDPVLGTVLSVMLLIGLL
jgi:hypothetical protein